jgi:hypothetical protein
MRAWISLSEAETRRARAKKPRQQIGERPLHQALAQLATIGLRADLVDSLPACRKILVDRAGTVRWAGVETHPHAGPDHALLLDLGDLDPRDNSRADDPPYPRRLGLPAHPNRQHCRPPRRAARSRAADVAPPPPGHRRRVEGSGHLRRREIHGSRSGPGRDEVPGVAPSRWSGRIRKASWRPGPPCSRCPPRSPWPPSRRRPISFSAVWSGSPGSRRAGRSRGSPPPS